jgi:RND superfamily putative drug exporter
MVETGFWARWARIVAGRWTRWITIVVWIGVSMVSLLFAFPKFDSILSTDLVDYLPKNAQSTQVESILSAEPSGQIADLIVVYVRDPGITEADFDRAQADAERIQESGLAVDDVVGPAPGSETSLEYGLPQALFVIVPMSVDATNEQIAEVVALAGLPTLDADGNQLPLNDWGYTDEVGLEIYVGGPAATAFVNSSILGVSDSTLFVAATIVVILVLLLTYRSPLLWLLPFIAVIVGVIASRGLIYLVHEATVDSALALVVNEVSSSVLLVLVFGAGTDYALLLTARYREELHTEPDKYLAMQRALRGSAGALVASAATVSAALLCLLLSLLQTNRSLGPVAALGILTVLLVMLTLFPALLTLGGRPFFWPKIPRPGDGYVESHGIYAVIGERISRRPRPVWIGTSLALGAMVFGMFAMNLQSLTTEQGYRESIPAIVGTDVLGDYIPPGTISPVQILAAPEQVSAVEDAVNSIDELSLSTDDTSQGDSSQSTTVDGYVLINAIGSEDPLSPPALDAVSQLREQVPDGVLVGGSTAINLDLAETNNRDRVVVIPAVLIVILIILMILLRALVAPVLLLLVGLLSFGAALGISALLFRYVLDAPYQDPGYPLIVFIFLVALAVDYNIFLMHRVQEETVKLGTRKGNRWCNHQCRARACCDLRGAGPAADYPAVPDRLHRGVGRATRHIYRTNDPVPRNRHGYRPRPVVAECLG